MVSSSKSGKKQKQKGLGSLPSMPSEPGVSFADRHWQAERAAPVCAVAKEGGEAPASCRQGLFCTHVSGSSRDDHHAAPAHGAGCCRTPWGPGHVPQEGDTITGCKRLGVKWEG